MTDSRPSASELGIPTEKTTPDVKVDTLSPKDETLIESVRRIGGKPKIQDLATARLDEEKLRLKRAYQSMVDQVVAEDQKRAAEAKAQKATAPIQPTREPQPQRRVSVADKLR